MKFQGAVVREQGVIFAVVVVKQSVLSSNYESTKASRSFQAVFPGIPVILMAQDPRGVPTYLGRRDIAQYLANVPFQAIPWRQYMIRE
jgi:hypothetical protein